MAIKQRTNSADPATAKTFQLRTEAFIHHYVWGEKGVAGVGARSCEEAGFAKSRAKSQAHRLLHRPDVRARVDEEVAEKRRQLKARTANVAAKMYDQAVDGDVPAATVFLRWAGELKEKVEVEVGQTLEQLIDAALKLKD